ncbi:glycosyltransferase [Lederbergia wuyishanensis]|uniref:Glycosyltransferase involved in cell wall biosynthesis n=1 Tax=Lederbergia wuyishanensis TaxID=1347903 RepID=A0ABU0D7W6_9BACI|nr:glycosyltransferase [Lederbergia wuyishanensis]MCJ8009133.1 glycosyltransferase [Lederbergia wuyishanensis]MDQ0344473.1 glycosyltransferase involved in cell wall biosynthesis [Lederbergia wuyishanensis]
MKKKIFFMVINMNVGGTEKALLNMISEMPKDKFDITILMLERYGGFIDSIPIHVNVKVYNDYKKIKELITHPLHITGIGFLKKRNVIKGFTFLLFYFLTKIIGEKSLFYKYLLKDYPVEKIEYDIAVAYAGPMDFISYFIAHKVRAKKKIQWIHFDVTKIGFNKRFSIKTFKKYDQLFAVSKEAKDKLIDFLPSLKNRIDVFLNIISSTNIKELSIIGEGFNDSFEGYRILTVGRLSLEKGQDLAIKAVSKLIRDGYKIRWYCIGDGSSKDEYEKLITQYNLEKHFILLGTHTNPYPFIKQCDIYVQPSRYEGYCMTILEAKCLNKPILTTNFNGANEQIKNYQTGIIVNFDETQLYQGIKTLIDNQSLRKKIRENLEEDIETNIYEIDKLIKIAGL